MCKKKKNQKQKTFSGVNKSKREAKDNLYTSKISNEPVLKWILPLIAIVPLTTY